MNKILEVKFGSHLYETNTENSDLEKQLVNLLAGLLEEENENQSR